MTGETYCLLAASLWSLPVTCLRYFNVYGFPSEDSDYSGVISIFFRRLAEGKSLMIYGDGRQSRDFVYVLDVVQALLRAAIRGEAGRVYNIGSGRATDLDLLARTVCEVAGATSTQTRRSGESRGTARRSKRRAPSSPG